MPGLTYPFVFACQECGAEAVVERSDVRDLHPNPDHLDAPTWVLTLERGWHHERGMVLCSDCAQEATPEAGARKQDPPPGFSHTP
jgi:hypothetical protein